jgi:thiamine-phosphate pyrophosphorylase
MTMPSCRLYLVAPVRDDLAAMIQILNAAAEGGDIAALLIPHELAIHKDADTLVEAAQRQGIAAIIGQDAALALSLRADGVEIEADPAAYTAARAKLGATAITGANCGMSRHNAMTLGEAGADYVALASTPGEELISWWSGLFEVPCVCTNELSLEDAPAVIRAGADFVRPDASMWQSPDAARRMVDSFNRLIAEHAP